jgi:hypothetical protein
MFIYKVLVGKPEGTARRKREDSFTIYLKEIGYEGL